ncbi:MAG: DUF4340 domain-containing protein [Planctomycetes bacterium]|nr:DUF4340 domain-containing protein [Planctomycetota bacterium]
MNWKTTVALAVIVLFGSLYIFVVETQQETTSELEDKGKKVFSDEKSLSDHVQKIAIKRKDAEFRFERVGSSTDAPWKMTEPLKARADKSEVKAIASALEDIQIKNAVSGADKELKLGDYGLESPRAEVSFSSGSKEYQLFVGDSSPSDEDEIFVRRSGSDRVYLVPKSIYEKVNKSLTDYRDKKVVDVERDKVLSLKLDWRDKTDLLASKTASEWQLAQPVDDYANKTKLEGLIDKVRDLKIDKEDFYSENMDDPARFGLGLPQLAITLQGEVKAPESKEGKEEEKGKETPAAPAGRQEWTILLGSAVEGKSGKIYAKRTDEPTIFGVSDSILKDLEVGNVKDFRSTDFALFDDDDVNKVEIKLVSGPIIVEQVSKEKKGSDSKSGSSSDEKVWKLTQPMEREADKSAVDSFIDALDELKIENFVHEEPGEKELEACGLTTPSAAVTLTLKDDKGSLAYELGKVDESNIEQFYARRSGRKNVFLLRKKGFHRDVLTGLLLFRKKQVIEFSKSDVQKLVVAQGDRTVVVKKGKDEWTWQLTQPVTAPADNSNVDNILWGINSLEAVRFVAESPADLAPYGLDKPSVRVVVELEEAEKAEKKEDEDKDENKDDKGSKKKIPRTVTLLVGNKAADEDAYFARLEEGKDKDVVFIISQSKYDTLTKELHEREVVDITRSEVKQVTLQYPDVTVTCEKQEGKEEWKLSAPRQADAKKTEVEDILDELDPLKGEKLASYKATEASELAPYGLDKPEFSVKVGLKDGKDKTVHIGALVKEGTEEYYAVRAADKDAVYLVRKGVVATLRKSEKDLTKEASDAGQDQKKPEESGAGKEGASAGDQEKSGAKATETDKDDEEKEDEGDKDE